MIGYPLRQRPEQDRVTAAFEPLNAIQQNTSGMLQQLQQMQQLRMAPQQAEIQQQDSLLRSLGDLLSPQVIQHILQQRMPDMPPEAFAGANPAQPTPLDGVSPEQLEAFKAMLMQPPTR